MNLVFITDFSESRNQSGFLRVIEREFRRVSVEFCQVVANGDCTRRFTDSFTDSGHSARRNSLLLQQLNLEARVGIEPTMQLLQSRALPLGYPAIRVRATIWNAALLARES